jgi:hypothetical protein
MLSKKDCVSSLARRHVKRFSLGKEVDISFQKRIGLSPKSEFLRPESLVPPFLVSFQSASVVRTYPSILQQFIGNLNCKKVFTRRSPFSSAPNHSKLGRSSPGESSSQRIKKKEFNPSIQREKMGKWGE